MLRKYFTSFFHYISFEVLIYIDFSKEYMLQSHMDLYNIKLPNVLNYLYNGRMFTGVKRKYTWYGKKISR
jgi:hypothetical protein